MPPPVLVLDLVSGKPIQLQLENAAIDNYVAGGTPQRPFLTAGGTPSNPNPVAASPNGNTLRIDDGATTTRVVYTVNAGSITSADGNLFVQMGGSVFVGPRASWRGGAL